MSRSSGWVPCVDAAKPRVGTLALECLPVAGRGERTPRTAVRAVARPALRPPNHRAAAVGTVPTDAVAEPVRQTKAALLPRDLLDGGETIIFAIKPSLWFAVFDSAKWIVAAMAMIISAGWFTQLFPSITEAAFMSVVLVVLAVRVGIALLRWVSRFYVLTNRRIMRIRGVFTADVFECPLVNIDSTVLSTDFAESLANLGTIDFVTVDRPEPAGAWRNLNRPQDVHTEVRHAIDRSRHCQPRI